MKINSRSKTLCVPTNNKQEISNNEGTIDQIMSRVSSAYRSLVKVQSKVKMISPSLHSNCRQHQIIQARYQALAENSKTFHRNQRNFKLLVKEHANQCENYRKLDQEMQEIRKCLENFDIQINGRIDNTMSTSRNTELIASKINSKNSQINYKLN